MMIFLPPLLFESAAFGVDMGILRKQLGQILLMAFPAMLVASVLTGLLVWACAPDWSFWVCWLIGTIVSATDPVAVVALLKDLGAPKELGMPECSNPPKSRLHTALHTPRWLSLILICDPTSR